MAGPRPGAALAADGAARRAGAPGRRPQARPDVPADRPGVLGRQRGRPVGAVAGARGGSAVEPRAHGADPDGAGWSGLDPRRLPLRRQPRPHAPPVGTLPRRPDRRARGGVARAGGADGARPVAGAGRCPRGAARPSELGSARRSDPRCVGRAPPRARRQPGRGRTRPRGRDRPPGGRAARDVRRAARRRSRSRRPGWRFSDGIRRASGCGRPDASGRSISSRAATSACAGSRRTSAPNRLR